MEVRSGGGGDRPPKPFHLSKISLDTAGIFAWTAGVCALSYAFEKGVLAIVRWGFEVKVSLREPARRVAEPAPVSLRRVSKAFGEAWVLKDLSMTVLPGETQWITWPSGGGKTTLLRILAGLEQADGGEASGVGPEQGVCMLFQEDRLCPEESALRNVEMVTGSRERAGKALAPLLEQALWEKPCQFLSGGEKRRVALARALAARGSLLLLDEPFAGLDQERAEACLREIQREKGDRMTVIASHVVPRA